MQPVNVLLIEDNPADADFVREVLLNGSLDVEVTVATTGAEAWRMLSRDDVHATAPTPDLIILDLNLPGIDGRAVLARIKADERLRVRPVVILTSSDAERDIVQSYELGANCYIVKPMDFNGFRAAVGAVETFWLSLVSLPRIDR